MTTTNQIQYVYSNSKVSGTTLISGYDTLPVKPYNITNCWVVAMPTHELGDPKAYSDIILTI